MFPNPADIRNVVVEFSHGDNHTTCDDSMTVSWRWKANCDVGRSTDMDNMHIITFFSFV